MATCFTKSFYKIREVAEIIGVPQSTLRYWEKEFHELNPRRSSHNQRYYKPEDLEMLQIIHYLLHIKGLKVDAAREYLKHNKKNVSRNLKVLAKLENAREDLRVLLNSLNLRGEKLGLDLTEEKS